jgi:aminomethyltransferase
LSLYGHDLNEETTPVEANLSWLIGKRRREQGGFLGAEKIIDQLKNGAPRKRVGLNILGKAPAREFTEIVDQSGNKIGAVTSGTFSPCLNRPISMGYVATALSKNGTKLGVNIRGKVSEAEVVKMPFVPSNYYKPT